VNRRLPSILLGAACLILPASASAADSGKGAAQPIPAATVKVQVGHLHDGRAPIYHEVPVTGTLSPFVPGQRVEVTFYLNGNRLLSRKVAVSKGKGGAGVFRSSVILRENGKYAVSAHHIANSKLGADTTVRKSWRVSFPSLRPGQCGRVVKGFKKAMKKMGYASGGGSCFNGRLGREVLAYRKVNSMARTQKAGAGLVKKVFSGRGGYRVRHPDAGRHVEVSIDKQVMVLAKGDKPYAIYPVSTGKSSTPTVTGHFTFIRREPGYNSHGMYYSFYFHGGYAVHGYEDVPDYPASHGCVRTFIADQPRIYEQLEYGESIFVF
jgi:L,D-transpeptidase catalytic domain